MLTFRGQIPSSGPVFSTGAMGRLPITLSRQAGVPIGTSLRLQLHGTIYRPDSFVSMLHYCANLKAIRYESTRLNRILADKSRRVIVALDYDYTVRFIAPILLY